ncbi:uncharacterized protein LOC115019010 isoform X2 [Cottoperca gobio]|uniref:Uncharacterized protein LOC115019010 isoform X2 n=1 Tax=Cottoperca gobio TaxID=56716 RepID=A0A6J2R1M4_COTGO|nr:uncharacterized protein LOC115019010 isoform X2 [Cottoperca gobio]
MGRHKYRVRRDSGLPNKRDTPVKAALNRREKYKTRYEALSEEMTVRPNNPVLTSIKPVHCKSVLRSSSLPFTENPRDKAVSPAAPATKKSGYRVSPAGHTAICMTPEPVAFKGGDIPGKEEEQSLAVTTESITCSSMESDNTCSSDDDDDDDDDDDEDCYSSASTSSSSFPSPEIFRRESYVETLTFPIKLEPGLHLHIKNSTLLDESHAEGIYMYHPPNLSDITGNSIALRLFLKRTVRSTKTENLKLRPKYIRTLSNQDVKWKTPSKLTNRRPILYKKKVWFKSPIIAETVEAKHILATKLTIYNANEPAHTSSTAEQIQPDADTFTAGEISSKEALQLTGVLQRPVKSNPEKVTFFDFIDDSERDAFFEEMRIRCVELESAPLFPLTAPKYTEPSVL